MTTIDEVEELRIELRHCRLTLNERRIAALRLAELLQSRDDQNHDADVRLPGSDAAGRNESTRT